MGISRSKYHKKTVFSSYQHLGTIGSLLQSTVNMGNGSVPRKHAVHLLYHRAAKRPAMRTLHHGVGNIRNLELEHVEVHYVQWWVQILPMAAGSQGSTISCLALAEKVWQVFHGHNPHSQLCCSTHKCILLTNVVTFSGSKQAFQRYRIYCKKLWDNKEIKTKHKYP